MDFSAEPAQVGALKGAVVRNLPLDDICAEVAHIFSVGETEVALLQVKRSFLEFLFPRELKAGGAIPLSSSAVAAKTVAQRTAAAYNNFTTVQHASIFEVVKLGSTDADLADQVIQKLISAPVFCAGKPLGVIQICRKGRNAAVAGPDFTAADLDLLEQVAKVIAPLLASAPSSSV